MPRHLRERRVEGLFPLVQAKLASLGDEALGLGAVKLRLGFIAVHDRGGLPCRRTLTVAPVCVAVP